jgi:hypothetical protein
MTLSKSVSRQIVIDYLMFLHGYVPRGFNYIFLLPTVSLTVKKKVTVWEA